MGELDKILNKYPEYEKLFPREAIRDYITDIVESTFLDWIESKDRKDKVILRRIITRIDKLEKKTK